MEQLGLVLLRVFAALPYRLMKLVADVSGWLMWQVNGRLRKITERNLEISFPDLAEEERIHLARNSLQELSLSILQAGQTWLWPLERLEGQIERVVGEDYLRAAVASGRPLIVLLPHLGNWELAGLVYGKRYPATGMYQPPKSGFLSEAMLKARERGGIEMVPVGLSGVRALLKALKTRRTVLLLPDQVPPPEFGGFAPFFGEPTLTMTLVSNLIQRTDAKALCCYCKRLPGGKFELVYRDVDEALYDDDQDIALAALNRSVEHCVMDCPEQYQWEYKRFKVLPNMQRRDYFSTYATNSKG